MVSFSNSGGVANATVSYGAAIVDAYSNCGGESIADFKLAPVSPTQ